MTICDVCSHEMWDTESQTNLIGTVMKLTISDNVSHPEVQRVKDLFGKLEFNVCFVCWLKSLGVKERGVK